MNEPQVGQTWNKNVPGVHFSAVTIRDVRDGHVEFTPTSCWYDPNTVFVAKVETFRRKYTLA